MNSKLSRTSLMMTLVMLLVSACGMLPTLGSRRLISENWTVSGFNHLEVSGGGDLTIIQDGTEALRVETDDNVMQYVTSKVQDGTLAIGLDFPGLRLVIPSRLSLVLHVKDLTGINTSGSWNVASESIQAGNLEITASGSGKVTILTLNADRLTVDITGSGEMDLAGRVKSQDITISGSGSYNGGDLQAQDTRVGISGSGNVSTWATDSLEASISGMGTVSYYGSPQVTFNQSGSGNLKSLGQK